MAEKIIVQGELVLPEGIVSEGEVVMEADRIVEVNLTPTHANPTVRWRDGWIFPGLVDVHIHGIAGDDVMDGSVESLGTMDDVLARVGCTRYLATTMSANTHTLMRVLESVEIFQKARPLSGLLGAHLEGPFIHPDRRGAQSLHALRRPSLFELETYYRRFGLMIQRITLAPELPDAEELLDFCLRVGIRASLGHSNATYDEAIAAFDAGAHQVTHLFNAMTGLNHRDPGLAGAALTHPDSLVEVIVDGVHLHPSVVRLIRTLKGPRQVMLVTDAMRAALLKDGIYDLGGQRVTVSRGVARTVEGHLAGSTLTLLDAVFHYQQFAGIELYEAVRAASLIPARAMGWGDLGALEPGFKADVLLVDRQGANRMTWRAGHLVFDGR